LCTENLYRKFITILLRIARRKICTGKPENKLLKLEVGCEKLSQKFLKKLNRKLKHWRNPNMYNSVRYKKKTRQVGVRISQWEEDLLRSEAKKTGRSMNSLIREGYLGRIESFF
jgi:hypothetical protein